MQSFFEYMIMLGFYCFVLYPKWKKDNCLLKTLFYLYLCMVISVTLLPLPSITSFHWPSRNILNYGNFTLFIDLIKNRPLAVKEIVLNILMLIPFGVLYPFAFKKKALISITLGIGLSVVIETLQLLFSAFLRSNRTFDVTDILTNAIGCVIGVLIYKVLSILIGFWFKNTNDQV